MDSAAPLLIFMLAGLSLASNSTCDSLHTTDGNDIEYTTIEGYITSDLLLPCFFNITLISQAEYNNASVIWEYTSRNEYVLEFDIQSPNRKTWGNWGQRIKSDKNQITNGNFSILILNVDLEVGGNISCSLYYGINCIRARRILQVLIKEKDLSEERLLLPLTISFGLIFILVAVVVVCVLKIRGCKTKNCETRTDMAPTTIYITMGNPLPKDICRRHSLASRGKPEPAEKLISKELSGDNSGKEKGDQSVMKENEIYDRLWHN